MRHLWGTTRGLLNWYYDPLPTNCVAARVCLVEGQCHGGRNLAVFFRGCTFNCLYCQNWAFKDRSRPAGALTPEEVGAIARFLAGLDRAIPYSLLALHPHFFMGDLPPTSRAHAEACYRTALGAGLRHVRVGNTHLLW